MQSKPIAVVTGAYRGLGLETCRQLAEKGYSLVLTARREPEGLRAVETLRAQGLEVDFQVLDVLDEDSIQQLVALVKARFGRLDVLVNNAGIFPDPAPGSGQESVFDADLDVVRRGLETNTLAVLRLCQLMIPLMDGRGRVVNVSSGMGQLSDMNGGCPGYRLSKTALNAVTRIFADELSGTGVKINSVCPGWVRTEMGGAAAPLDVSEGAKGIVWAATLSDDGPSGGFFRHGEPIAW
ncbi:SDR family oxidoreductase [Thiorhodococcus mannitoliphagus]|uniref:SDR family oxidoreductase n=1 Tax=Thiorhodococcus mannitoliphagus TaxID=329406 RepID=A0A6P1E5Z3_9GAMM|nr:SDR family oxidoreductase [Thiorhodococcus mannitoliphagus]NEX22995.1 SDR family oxidoreductase [Thiorhodococcus mannitoliphagus]